MNGYLLIVAANHDRIRILHIFLAKAELLLRLRFWTIHILRIILLGSDERAWSWPLVRRVVGWFILVHAVVLRLLLELAVFSLEPIGKEVDQLRVLFGDLNLFLCKI